MDRADAELRETIKNIWPLQAEKMVDLLVPPNDFLNSGKMTVGKVYAGLLILESWKSTRFGQTGSNNAVRFFSKSILSDKSKKSSENK